MDSRAVIRILETAGWRLKRVTGSHHHFMHSGRKEIVTVPHPKKELAIGTLRSIEKQAGIKLR